MPESSSSPEMAEKVRYICRIIDGAHFSLDLKWSGILDMLSYSLDIDRKDAISILKEAEVGYGDDESADFLVAGVFDASIKQVEAENIFAKLLSRIQADPLFSNLLMLISTEYDFTLALLEFLFRRQGHHLLSLKDAPLLPVITNDIFIESTSSNKYVKDLVKKVEVDLERVKELVRNDWFMDLMNILKTEISVNESSGFIKLIDREAHTVNAQEIVSLISDGTLEMIVLHRNQILKEKFVNAAFMKRYEAEQHEKKLRRFYYWLGIANDFILGVEFLVGSIEFLPGMPQGSLFIGVLLFIIGSCQLVARSVIQIVMNLHIRTSRKKKMQELPS